MVPKKLSQTKTFLIFVGIRFFSGFVSRNAQIMVLDFENHSFVPHKKMAYSFFFNSLTLSDSLFLLPLPHAFPFASSTLRPPVAQLQHPTLPPVARSSFPRASSLFPPFFVSSLLIQCFNHKVQRKFMNLSLNLVKSY